MVDSLTRSFLRELRYWKGRLPWNVAASLTSVRKRTQFLEAFPYAAV